MRQWICLKRRLIVKSQTVNDFSTPPGLTPWPNTPRIVIFLCCFLLGPLLFSLTARAAEVTIYDVMPGANAYVNQNPIDVNGMAFFAAASDANTYATDLWRVRPGDATAQRLTNGCAPYELVAVQSEIYFACFNDSSVGGELWKSDGTAAGTVLVMDFNGSASPQGITNVDGILFFSLNGGNTAGRELWKLDTVSGVASMVRDITPGTASTTFATTGSYPNFAAVGSVLFFVADNGTSGQELWKSDGTEAGTVMVKDINPGTASALPFSSWGSTFAPVKNLINHNGVLFFPADDGSNGVELWKSDGTADGTVMVRDITPGSGSSRPDDFAVSNGMLFFVANNGLWKSDGTDVGTTSLRSVSPSWLTDVGGTLFFQGDDGSSGAELWKSDGTVAGTVMVKDINPGSAASSPGKAAGINGRAYFSADDGVNGGELWVSDGTESGTLLLADINPGSSGSSIDEPVGIGGSVFFIASNPASGAEVMSLEPPPPGPAGDSSANYRYAAINLDPINTFNGELFSRKARDIDLGGPMPLYFQRYYSSYLRRSYILGDLGSNWRHNFDARLYWVGNTVTYVSSDGRVTKFVKDVTAGRWVQQGNSDTSYQLVAEAGQDAKLYDPQSRLIYTFDYTTDSVIMGRLVKIEDGRGNTHTLTYNNPTNAQLKSVGDGLGRTLYFTYNLDAIPKISVVSDGVWSVSFQYMDANDSEVLTVASDGLPGFTTYSYKDTSAYADHALMLSMTRPRGNIPYTQTFVDVPDPASGRVASQADANGNVFSFAYDGQLTTITDPLGNTRTDTHSTAGALLRQEDDAGGGFSVSYDALGRRQAVTDRLGNRTAIDYAVDSGEISSITNADGSKTSFTYAERDFAGLKLYDLSAIVHADGGREGMEYDASGRMLRHTDQLGNVTTTTYNANGQALTMTNAGGGLTTLTYNADATLASMKGPDGNTTLYSHDAMRRVNLVTYADGTSRAFAYNAKNRLTSITDERGESYSLGYDVNTNLTSLTDPLANVTSYAYDGNDRLVQRTDPLGNVMSRSFDALGRISGITDENGNVTTWSYDARGRVVGVTDPLGGLWSRSYDAESVVTSTSDPLGNVTRYQSDAMGRITRITSPLGNVTQKAYDVMGRISRVTDALGGVTTYSYDIKGQMTGIALAGNSVVASYARDALGNIVTTTDPVGNEWQRSFDPQGRRTKDTDPLGNVQALRYDSRSRVSRIDYPGGLGTQSFDYDLAGNILRRSYSDGTTLTYQHDARRRLVSADGIVLAYDANDRLTASNGIAISRDAGGRITAMTLANGKVISYGYDAADRVTQVSDGSAGTIVLSYDDAGRLVGVSRPNGIDTEQTYDADGRLTTISEGTVSRISLTRDANGQVIRAIRNVPRVASADGMPDISADFDAAAQITGMAHDAMGRVTGDGGNTYTWNLASRLLAIDDGSTTVTASYDVLGLRLTRSESGVTREYVWNYALDMPSVSIERLAGTDLRYYVHTPDGELLYSIEADSGARRFYHFDEAGNTLFVSDDNGVVIGSYAYTPFGRLIGEDGGLDNSFTWQGRFGVMHDGADIYYMRARYYDATTGRFMSRDPFKSIDPREINPYQYARNNPVNNIDPQGLQGSLLREVQRRQEQRWKADREKTRQWLLPALMNNLLSDLMANPVKYLAMFDFPEEEASSPPQPKTETGKKLVRLDVCSGRPKLSVPSPSKVYMKYIVGGGKTGLDYFLLPNSAFENKAFDKRRRQGLSLFTDIFDFSAAVQDAQDMPRSLQLDDLEPEVEDSIVPELAPIVPLC